MKLQKDLREFIELLNSAGARYVVVGGYAVAFHGYPRFTGDIDVFVDASKSNATKMNQVVREFGFQGMGLAVEDFAKPDAIVQLGMPPNRIDIITAIHGVSFEEAWNAKVDAMLDGTPVHFISKEMLLKNKRTAGRAQDLADVEKINTNGGGE